MLKDIKLHKTVFNLSELPKERLPELVICGRSNVGKSSFINSIFNKKNLARTSSLPGKTRSLNYFLVDNKYYFVDLPGYGYAKVSKEERARWGRLISDFFTLKRNIQMIIHLIDSRHHPTELDIHLNNFLKELNYSYIFVMTKADKLNQSELEASKKDLMLTFPEAVLGKNLFTYSSTTAKGKKEILNKLNSVLENVKVT